MNSNPGQTLKDDDERARIFKRFQMQFTVLVNPSFGHDSPLAQGPVTKIRAVVSDISVSGLSFRSEVELPTDALILLDILIATHAFCIPVIVRRCRTTDRAGRKFYTCGAHYVKCEATTKFVPILAKYLLVWGLQ